MRSSKSGQGAQVCLEYERPKATEVPETPFKTKAGPIAGHSPPPHSANFTSRAVWRVEPLRDLPAPQPIHRLYDDGF